ncbi:MAG: DEAD/DEAH box helicase family protein [Actinomycetota bacterium]
MTQTAVPRAKSYWQAEGVVTRGLARFEAAVEANRPDRQRAAFYQFAKYQARTIHILHSAFESSNEALAKTALHNLMALHRAMLQIHSQTSGVVPLPILLREEATEELTNDLIMRVLTEGGAAMSFDELLTRLRHLNMLGPVAPEDIEDNLERLEAAKHIQREDDQYSATRLSYTEIDFNMRGLRALLGPNLYERFEQARFRRLSHVNARPVEFENTFAKLTGLTDPETCHLFQETAEMVHLTSLEAVRPWHFHDIVDSAYPRPYQREAYRVFKHGGYLGNVIEAPTGSGKTMIGMMCTADGLRILQPGQSILILVPTAAYQQQWLAELCFHEIGLRLSPEMVFTGTPTQLAAFIRRTGQHPAIVLLTYTSLSQLSSGIGKGGFDRDSLEIFLQEANIQYVLLDEIHKVVSDMHSVSTDVTRLLVEWRLDNSIRALIGFSGTAEAYRHRFEELGLDLVHTIPMDDLVAAGFVAPFAELGIPFSNSARERQIREQLEAIKEAMREFFHMVGGERLRAWFAGIPIEDRLRIGHELLGMYRGRKDWEVALRKRFDDWESGDDLKLTEANLVLIVQMANGWTDTALAAEAGVPNDQLTALKARLEGLRGDLLDLIYLPQTIEHLQAPGFMTTLDLAGLDRVVAEVAASHRVEAAKDVLVTTVTGLYSALKGWYLRVGEGRVETIKAVIEAERALRDITGTIVFDTGRKLHWRDGLATPGYEGVGGLFSQMLGDERFTVMAALSSELYLSHDADDPLPDRIADFVDAELLLGEAADAIFSLAVQALDLDAAHLREFEALYRTRIERYVPLLREIRTPRPGDFHRRVIRPLRRRVENRDLGVTGDRMITRLKQSNEHLRGLIGTFFDYAMIAHKFRTAHVAELEQVSGARQKFFVVPMPGTGDRKQLMYELTSRIVDEETLPVNLIIVSSWARTGWNVIAPNLLIDATATQDVTAWQQLRGRAIRADRRWSNDCYRLETLILDSDPLSFSDEDEGGDEEQLDDALRDLLKEVATRPQFKAVTESGFAALDEAERGKLATRLMMRRNKVTHVYELVKAFGSTTQVTYDRADGRWERKDPIAAKHAREIAVNPLTGEKSQDESHAPLIYVDDPRSDLPADLEAKLAKDLRRSDERIVRGWLGI